MKGPQFLLLYLVIEILLIGIAYFIIRSLVKKNSEVLSVSTPDALPIAFLAGGTNHLLYTILFRLYITDKIKLSDNNEKVEGKRSKDPIKDKCEKLIYDYLGGPQKIFHLRNERISKELKSEIEHHSFFARYPELIFTHSSRLQAMWIRRMVIFLLIAISAYRIITGIMAGMHKFLFLIILTVAGWITAALILRLPRNTEPTEEYTMYLKTLNPLPSEQVFKQSGDYQKSLFLALYGRPILEYLHWGTSVDRHSTNTGYSGSSSSCGSGCSSSSSSCGSGDSGSSCGGCGGCGGGD